MLRKISPLKVICGVIFFFPLSLPGNSFPIPIPGDANGDGGVDHEDLLLVQKDWRKGQKQNIFEISLPGLRFHPGARPLKMVPIPAGSFVMGSTTGAYDSADERPLHEVTLTNNFFISQTEITQAQWIEVMGRLPSSFGDARGIGYNRPISWINWDEAMAFTAKLNEMSGQILRLPTEAEWEYCCRGPASNANRYSLFWFSGNSSGSANFCISDVLINRFMVHCGNSEGGAQEVASRAPNGYGLYDMGGNVSEWCLDAFDSGFYSTPEAVQPNPIRLDDEFHFSRSVRDGNWNLPPLESRSSSRMGVHSEAQGKGLGFRIVMEVHP